MGKPATAGAPDTPATVEEKVGAELAALHVERAGYVARDLPGRVALVDEQIRLHGGKPPRA